jgi:PAS domain S-box-containing protein
MDQTTMSYTQLLQAYKALQERVMALEGTAAVQPGTPGWEHEAPHTAGTDETVIVPEACLVGGREMGKLIREYNWSATPLGPVETWPQSLRSAVSILLPSKAQIVLFWGPELITIYNDAYAPTFGAKHPWALGRPAREGWSEVWHILGPLFEGVIRTGEAFWAKDHPFFLHRQGFLEETYYDVSYDPVRIEDGSVGGIFCIVSEQTGRVLGERRLRTLRDLGTRTADAKSAEAVCRTAAAALAMDPADVPFALLYLIDGTGSRLEIVGGSGVEIDDLACRRDIVIADVDALVSAREGRAAEVETEVFVLRAPESAAERVLVLPISSGTQIVGVLVAGVSRFLHLAGDYRDFFDLAAARISAAVAHARAYEEEHRRAEVLAELDRTKTAFFSNVSHEFRTPLTLMLGPVEDILARPAEPILPAHRELLTVVQRNGMRLQKLVNTLLDFSRIEAGRAQAVYEPTDLATLTAELTSNFRSACERAGLRLVVDCPALSEPVYVDRDMWEKVVLNLLSNAFKFTFAGEIVVSLRPAGEAMELAIRDTGIGIPAAEIPHLFERFYRVAGASGRTHEGTGIGLALVQELVKLHGGSVRVESTPGLGSTFIVSIPTGTAHLPADRIGGTRTLTSTALGADPYVEEALRWLPDAAPLPLTPPGSGTGLEAVPVSLPAAPPLPALHGAAQASSGPARILWADDNADMRHYVRRLLSTRYDVEAVADGEAALAAARARRPDLVLADVMMPRLDGFGVLRALRADPQTRTLPVILLSARAGEEARIEGLEAGADAYLVKPFSARELLAHVEAHLELGRLRGRVAAELSERQRAEETRERLAAIVDSSDDAIIGQTLEGLITSWNRGAERLYGYTTAEVLGQPLSLLVPPDLPDDLPHLLSRLQRGEAISHYETQRLHKDGTRRDVSLTISPIRDGAGRIVGASKIARDITERRRAEQTLRESEQRYRRLFDTAGVSLWEGDFSAVKTLIEQLKTQGVTDFRRFFAAHPEVVEQAIGLVQLVDVNAETVRMFGARDKQELLVSLHRILVPETRQVFVDELLTLAEGRTFYQSETVLQTLQGTRLHVLFTLTFPPSDVRFSSVLVSLTDITIRKQAEEALRDFNATLAQQVAARTAETEARAQELVQVNAALRQEMATRQQAETQLRQQQDALFQREKLAAMGTLLASVAHELNNPLAVILMQADLLRADAGGGPLAEYAADITEAATRCERLVRQFLTLARQHAPERTAVDLHALITDTLELLAPALRVDTITVELGLGADLPRLWADPHQLQQVLVNLVTNAQQALRDVAAPRQLRLATRWHAARSRVTLEIADSGPGISPELQARIFEPFFTTKAPGMGTGLGLPLCQGIIEGHGGSISVSSAPGQGTTFRIELPVDTVPTVPAGLTSQDEARATVPGSVILLVDDEPGIAKALPRLLQRDGHTVDTAANGRLALALLQERSYDLILCDLRMPELDGPGLYRALEQQAPQLCRRFLFLTGDTLSPEVQDFLVQSGVPRLTKPFNAAEVRRAIAQALQALSAS